VGIGLANGFIEPLESTGLMLTHEAIMKLTAALKMRDCRVTKYDVDCFNFAFFQQIKDFKDFISQHYALSMRCDTPYWQQVSEHTVYDKKMIDNQLEPGGGYQDVAYRLHRSRTFDHAMSGIVYIAAGMGYNPMNAHRVNFMNLHYSEDLADTHMEWTNWLAHKEQVLAYIDTLPTHYEFLKKDIYKI
jgi:tryptophan halogenase